jgi:hypothetical protein
MEQNTRLILNKTFLPHIPLNGILMYIEAMETHQVYALCTGAKSPGIQM